jgi:hypothetical protein
MIGQINEFRISGEMKEKRNKQEHSYFVIPFYQRLMI